MTEQVTMPSPDELKLLVGSVGKLANRVGELAQQQQSDRASARRERRRNRIVAFTVAVDLILSLLVWRLSDQQSCQLHRAQALNGPSNARVATLGRVLDDIDPLSGKPTATRAQIEKDFHAARAASDAYLEAAAAHPPTCPLFWGH